MDYSTFSIRSIDESWLEKINSTGIDQHDRDGGGNAVEEMSNE